MTSLHLFLIIWNYFEHTTCVANTAPTVGEAGHPFFQGACTDAISYAKQVGGSWFFASGTFVVAHVA